MRKKMAAKGRAILKAKTSTRVPEFNVMDYTTSLIKALNYYRTEVENKIKKGYALEYWKKQNQNIKPLNGLHDSWFGTVGAVAHMVMNEVPIHDNDVIRLDNAYHQLIEIARREAPEKDDTVVENGPAKLSIQDHMDNAAKLHIAELESVIDDIIKKGDAVDVKQFLMAHQVKGPVAKRVGEWGSKRLKEYKEVLNDSELLEGYSNLGKRGLNKLISFMESVVADCTTVATISKTMRAPRKRKEKPASVLVLKMKWLRELPELGFKSVHAEKIVGSDTVFMFDKNRRKLIKYVALDGYTLSVKGTTLLNWDPEKSGSKIVRKPEVQLKGIQSMGKRPSQNLFNEIKATMGKLTGRTNDDCVIISVF